MSGSNRNAGMAMSCMRLVVAVVLVCCAAGACGDDEAERSGPPFYLTTGHYMDAFTVDPPRLDDDVPREVRAAGCRAYGSWLDQTALRPDVRILDDPGLVRSAELLDGLYSGEEVAVEVERQLIDEDGDETRALAWLAEHGWSRRSQETAAAYLEDRSGAPSEEAADRYVVYMVPSGLTSVLFVRLEIEPDYERYERTRSRVGAVGEELPDGTRFGVPEPDCWT